MLYDKIYVAGENGLVGSALVRSLKETKQNIISTSSKVLDLRDAISVKEFFKINKPDCVILVAAKHGGIGAYQNKPVEFLEDNVQICGNVIKSSYEYGVKKLINIGASCVYKAKEGEILKETDYDKNAVQIPTEPYGLAKLYGMKLCEYYNREKGTQFISLLPTNLYGNGIGYSLDESSVLPSMLKRFYHAKKENAEEVVIWGDGRAHREFLHVNDFVKAILLLMERDSLPYTMYNAGTGEIMSINELAGIVADVVEYKGRIQNDLSRPNGADRGILDCSRLRELGWKPEISFREGLTKLYENWVKRQDV